MSTLQPHPIFSLTLDGKDLTQKFADRLISLTLTDNRGYEADQLDLILDDTDGRLDIPLRGVQVKLALGWKESGLVPKGSFTVDEVEHTGTPDQLTIRARSADLRAGLTQQKERSWHDTDIGTVVREIAQENGLKAMISDPLKLKAIAHFDQTNESDISFLNRVAAMFDAIVTVKNGNLLFMETGIGVSANGKSLGL
ncbi:contractile injection system protein, VgrG/Pvc8 family [Methylobacillus glycogenes]|uniref:contractile injection system protein, VgrG/Pvc8 family n=1 Tax=Methylobacillus glycogenes TaxID=406 RepID=UPI0009DFF2AF|nr:contractile injection system protein, VgrG/Pvc8 family [Methylobacillus glycogenes]